MIINRWLPPKYHELTGQLVRFGISTGFSSACSVVLPIALHEGLGINERFAVATGFLAAYFGNMLLMRIFVFKSTNDLRQDIPRFIIANGIFRLAEYCAFLVLLAWTSLTYIIALVIVLSISAVLKFHSYRRLFGR